MDKKKDKFNDLLNTTLNNIMHGEKSAKKLNNIMYYVSPADFIDIVRTKKLQFVRADYLDDITEMKYIYKLIGKIIDEKGYSKDFIDFIKHNLSVKTMNDRGTSQSTKSYVCSFFLDKDNLSLWNSRNTQNLNFYYNINFHKDNLLYKFIGLHKSQRVDCRYGKVIYDYSDQKTLLEPLLNQLADIYKNILKDTDDLVTIKNLLFELIYDLSPFFKHSSLKSNQEFRVVFYGSNNDFILNNSYNFKIRDGIFVPCIGIPIEAESIYSIICSPYIKVDNVTDSIKNVLLKYGYDITKINVEKSSIPVKF